MDWFFSFFFFPFFYLNVIINNGKNRLNAQSTDVFFFFCYSSILSRESFYSIPYVKMFMIKENKIKHVFRMKTGWDYRR